jgi:hypothetical protein
MTTTYFTSDDGGVTSRPMTETEIATYEAVLADIKKEKARQAKAEADRVKLKADTIAKLGLTADEVAALLS